MHQSSDFSQLSSEELLSLAQALPDVLLPIFMRVLKESKGGAELFLKLMGEHDEAYRPLVDSFFQRYMNLALEDSFIAYNPLVVYLDPQLFNDIALVQTREAFFKRQTIATINEFLRLNFHLAQDFSPGEQDRAWNYFFGKIIAL